MGAHIEIEIRVSVGVGAEVVVILRDFLLERRGVCWRAGVLRLFGGGVAAPAGGVAGGDAAGLERGC